jgi:hypothetical protein
MLVSRDLILFGGEWDVPNIDQSKQNRDRERGKNGVQWDWRPQCRDLLRISIGEKALVAADETHFADPGRKGQCLVSSQRPDLTGAGG